MEPAAPSSKPDTDQSDRFWVWSSINSNRAAFGDLPTSYLTSVFGDTKGHADPAVGAQWLFLFLNKNTFSITTEVTKYYFQNSKFSCAVQHIEGYHILVIGFWDLVNLAEKDYVDVFLTADVPPGSCTETRLVSACWSLHLCSVSISLWRYD